LPAEGFRGTHVFVSNGETTFDYHGYHPEKRYLAHYRQKMMRRFPGWLAEFVPLDVSPASEAFCEKYRHRLGSQFPHDPFPRARAYLQRFTCRGRFARPATAPQLPRLA
jgi:hypothetical protein